MEFRQNLEYGHSAENRYLTDTLKIKSIFNSLVLFLCLSIQSYAQVINKGIGGNNTRQLLEKIDIDVIQENPDLVILMVGTNDLLNSAKMISYSEYENNLQLIVEKLKKAGNQVLLMSSPPVDSAYLFTRHDKLLYQQSPNDILDSAGHIVQKAAADNDALFLDLYNKFVELNLPRHNEDLFFRNQMNSGKSDGVHPTALGYHFIAEQVFQILKENKLMKNDMKIICFGDSITKGGGDKEKSYPSYLHQLIREYVTE